MNKKTLPIDLGSTLAAIRESLKDAELTEKAKSAFNDVIEELSSLVKKLEELTEEQKAKEIAELEEKVRKLEEIVKAEINNISGVEQKVLLKEIAELKEKVRKLEENIKSGIDIIKFIKAGIGITIAVYEVFEFISKISKKIK